MELRHDAVLTNPGSYVARPGSSSLTRILLRSAARMVPSRIGTSYSSPVRLSRTVRDWLLPAESVAVSWDTSGLLVDVSTQANLCPRAAGGRIQGLPYPF